MARRPRVFAPGLLYHIIVRGNQQQKTFRSDDDYKAYLDWSEKYRAKFREREFRATLNGFELDPNELVPHDRSSLLSTLPNDWLRIISAIPATSEQSFDFIVVAQEWNEKRETGVSLLTNQVHLILRTPQSNLSKMKVAGVKREVLGRAIIRR